MVAARRLRKSFVGEYNIDSYPYFSNKKTKKHILKDRKYVFKVNTLIKLLICIFIIFSIVIGKIFLSSEIKNSFLKKLYFEYNVDYSKEGSLIIIEDYIRSNNSIINSIVPSEIRGVISQKYSDKIKPFILSFKLVSVFNISQNIKKEDKEIINNIEQISQDIKTSDEVNQADDTIGIGGFQPISTEIIEEKTEVVSAISSVDNEITKLKSKNIELINPTIGTITSRYGIRDQVFKGVTSYHTGIDIGNKINTLIKSASKGVVKNIVYDDKYYGNYLEIEIDELLFKYAHLNSITVKIGDNVKVGEEIGKMGSTGMSTGSHLHFEIRVDGITINPEEVIKF